MGQFRIEITAVGGHGCQREVKDGGRVNGCRHMECPDCETRRFVERLKQQNSVESATLTHWPNDPNGGIVDNLLTGVRTGSFSKG